MKKLLLLFFTLILLQYYNSKNNDSLSLKYENLETKVKNIESNQLNYKIEKDLLKETYSNNYERINTIISIVLSVIGILGYLGIKDINSLKKEYEKELSNLKDIQSKFNIKSEEFDKNKEQFNDSLRDLIKQNEEQNRKIKFIELKEKIPNLIKEQNYTSALEFCNTALEIFDNDIDVLDYKGSILCRLNQLDEASKTYKQALQLNPEKNGIILNASECFLFAKNIRDYNELFIRNEDSFKNKDNGKLLEFFELIKLYHENKKEELLNIIKNYYNDKEFNISKKRINSWRLDEAIHFIHYQPKGELKEILQNTIWYWNGMINGTTLFSNLNINLPENGEQNEN